MSKGGGHMGLRSESRRSAFGCGESHRTRATIKVERFVAGFRRVGGKTKLPGLPNPDILMNMITCVKLAYKGHQTLTRF